MVNKDTATAAAKKAASAAKTAASNKKLAADAKAKKPATSTAAKKPAATQCKAGAGGKLPDGCKAPVTAKKPVVKPQKTASAAN